MITEDSIEIRPEMLSPSYYEHTRFFTEMLGDIDEPTLPFGLSDVGQGEPDINEAHLKLSLTLVDQLHAHARKLQVSVASICHLAWAQVLAKASGREAVVFGTMLHGRLQAVDENSNTIKPTRNVLPLRLNIDDRSVETAVRDAHSLLSKLLAHKNAPLELTRRCSGVPANSPLFSALLNYRHTQKTSELNASLNGVTFLDSPGQTIHPLTMAVDDNASLLCLKVQVMSPISSVRICAYMQQSLESLVDALTNSAKQPVRKINVMPPDECNLLLHEWNQTKVTHSPVCCLHQLFEEQVVCDGQAIAVESEGQTLSYWELNNQANRLAHYLISKGVKPDDRIALCVERNMNLVIAMLGILKAGCAYVPLDPAYSSQRLTNILLDADPLFLLADTTGRNALGNHQVPVIELEKSLPTDLPIDNPDTIKLGLTPANLAYIIYTSGSTGTPKGVMVEHANATNCIHWVIDTFSTEGFKHASFSTSVSFDMSLYECFVPLSMGTTLHVITNAVALTKSSNISMLSTVPSAVTALLNTNSLPLLLNYLHLIGEPLKRSLIERILLHDQIKELCNLYSLTETTFISTMHRFKPGDKVIETIGRPIANTRIYLLDVYGEPVLLGAEGEIYIGGNNVARGYLNRPELTAERFLPDPFSNDPTSRMYRTGDLARYLPDGNLVFLGRIDQQVKIRGFRIELGEIEARLVEHPQVREAVVQAFGNGSKARLVAYMVADSNELLVQDLRRYLFKLLPDYMVPAAYVCLPSLPLTHSGKLDRRSIPAPDEEAFARQQYEAPQNEMEENLAKIWSELFNIDRISRHDNFFELGGHSLLVTHFVNKAKSNDIHINARGVFSFPILMNLGEQIKNRSKRLYCDAAIPARQHGNEAPLFLLPDGKGDVSYAFELAHDIDKNIPVYVLPWPSPENKQPSSITEMASAMIAQIKKICRNGPCAITGYSGGGILAYEITKQLVSSGYPVSFLGLIDTYATIASPLPKTEMFLTLLRQKFPAFETFNDSIWWDCVSKLSLDDAIEEMHKTSIDLSKIDIEWEALLLKQRFNYQNICAAYKIVSLPIEVHLFKANTLGYRLDTIYKDKMDYHKTNFNYTKLGWEKYNLSTDFIITPVDGDHNTMMTDPKNRFLLGEKLTKCLLLFKKNH